MYVYVLYVWCFCVVASLQSTMLMVTNRSKGLVFCCIYKIWWLYVTWHSYTGIRRIILYFTRTHTFIRVLVAKQSTWDERWASQKIFIDLCYQSFPFQYESNSTKGLFWLAVQDFQRRRLMCRKPCSTTGKACWLCTFSWALWLAVSRLSSSDRKMWLSNSNAASRRADSSCWSTELPVPWEHPPQLGVTANAGTVLQGCHPSSLFFFSYLRKSPISNGQVGYDGGVLHYLSSRWTGFSGGDNFAWPRHWSCVYPTKGQVRNAQMFRSQGVGTI